MSLLDRISSGHASITVHRPLARTNDLVIEEFEDELLVYDEKSKRAHCLGSTAARVWRACDGSADVEALSFALGLPSEAVTQALDELESAELLHAGELQVLTSNGDANGVTRRQFGKRTAQVGGAVVAAPLVLSITAPEAWATATPIPFFCNLFTDQACGTGNGGCGSIFGCCCCSKGCPGEGSCKGCTSINACTGGNQVCATSNSTAGTDCSNANGRNPFTKCGCCGGLGNPSPTSQCGCGFGPLTAVDGNGRSTSGFASGSTTNPGSGCCDITSTGPSPTGPVGNRFVACSSPSTCVPCCNGKPIFPQASSEFGCCGGYSAPNASTDACNHTPPTGYLPVSC